MQGKHLKNIKKHAAMINKSMAVNISPVVTLNECCAVLLPLMYAFVDVKLTVALQTYIPESLLPNELITNVEA